MRENNLIASVALFSELYNSENYNGITDVIAEFIRGAVIYEDKYSFSSTELKELLNKVYGFDIPESVVRTTLQKFKDKIEKKNHIYHFTADLKNGLQDINKEFQEKSSLQEYIVQELYGYIEAKQNRKLTNQEKDEVFENLIHFLMDNNGSSDEYSNYISAFIISKSNNFDFKNNLNSIREGVILYQGINYTADLNQLGSWANDLTIYLALEHLFNALGYNGILYKEIFDDFLKLVREINQSQKNKSNQKRKKIELKYFEETEKEIDDFFATAESIKKGYKQLDPSKIAMDTILKGCNTPSDIQAKRVKFGKDLESMGIYFQDFDYKAVKPAYNVEDVDLVEELRKGSIEKKKHFDENSCQAHFATFTKINTFRKGVNGGKFEQVGHLYITENSFVKYLAHNRSVKFGEADIPFAKDIDFIITRFWFSLKKGFCNKQTLPKSFDVVTKAKIMLSSHITSSVSKGYDKLLKEKKEGKLTDEEAIARSYALRKKPNRPENITIENIDNSLDFLQDENYLENFYREKVLTEKLFEKEKTDKEKLEKELEVYRSKEKKEQEQENALILQQKRERYALDKWKEQRLIDRLDFCYFIKCFLPEFFVVFIGFFVKVSKPLNTILEDIGNWQYLFWLILAIVLACSIFGKTYIFSKERVKNGWKYLKSIFNYKKIKVENLKKFQEEFIDK